MQYCNNSDSRQFLNKTLYFLKSYIISTIFINFKKLVCCIDNRREIAYNINRPNNEGGFEYAEYKHHYQDR